MCAGVLAFEASLYCKRPFRSITSVNKRALVVIALLAGLALAAIFYFTRGPKTDLALPETLGAVAAQQTAELIGGSGEIALIVPGFGAVPAQEAVFNSFRNELKKNSQVTIAATEEVNLAPPPSAQPGRRKLKFFEPSAAGPPGALPPGQLGQMLVSYPQIKAVVYFLELPPLSEADLTAVRNHQTKLVVVCEHKPNYDALFQSPALALAIVPRMTPPPEPAQKPKTVRERFDQAYTVIKPDKTE